ncbi:hypothetical protein JCM5353_002605 [Sporobolomyces roseus]
MAPRTRSPTPRSAISSPSSPLVQASVRKHRYEDDDDYSTESDYSDDEGDRGGRRTQSSGGSSASNMIIFGLVLLLCAAAVAAVYFWNENRKNGSLSTTPSVTTQTVTTGAGTTRPVTGSADSPKPTKSGSTDDGGGGDDEEGEPSRSQPSIQPTPSSSTEETPKPSASNPSPSKSSDSPSPTKSDSPSPPSKPTDSSPPSDPNPSSSIVSQDLLDVLLKTHNDFRKIHQVDPLEWNETLAEASERWVENCVWEHSGGKLLEGGYGENLFGSSGTNSAQDTPVDGKAGVDAWNSEISMYTYDPPTGFTHETGHVTQTIWKGTKSVGCQFRNCQGLFQSGQWGSYLVCQYYPPGNYQGEFLTNVLPPVE